LADPFSQSSPAYAIVFKTQLEKLSGGRIRVDIYPNGQLGNLRSLVQQVRRGTIQMADISSGIMASLYYPQLEIFDMPYIFPSRVVARSVLDTQNPFTKKLVEDCAKKTGIRILSLPPFGFRHITNNVKPIKCPDDMKGLKIRTMEVEPHIRLMKAYSASPVPIPWLELYTSLQTKVVDGEEQTLQNIVMGRLYEVQKHLTLTQHVMGVGCYLINDKWYQALPDDLKRALVEAEKNARLTYEGFGELLDTQAIEKLESQGMQIYKPTPEELKVFREKAFPEIRNWVENRFGNELVSELLAAIEEAEKSLDKQTQATITKKTQ